ncbi:MAG: polysaccharide biosynthesis/export family protein [Cyanobacteria bacterium P01_A01_bin.37]
MMPHVIFSSPRPHNRLVSAIAPCLVSLSITAVAWATLPSPASAILPPEETATANTLQNRYILGPGDQIEIEVFGYEEFSGTKVILPDGTITMSLIGDVQASGQTLQQLTADLYNQLNVVLVEPAVTVTLLTLRPVIVTIAGEVQRPGPVQLRSLTTADSESGTPRAALDAMPLLSSALMEAGGVTSYADIRRVQVRRSLPDGNETIATINLWDAIWSENTPDDPILQAGDAIFVPRITEGDPLDRRLLARSSLSPDTIQVRVVGEVTAPGEIPVSPDSTISSAVASAGGPTGDASLRRVELVRLNDDGIIERQQVDLRNLIDDFQVQQGDVVFVPKRRSFAGVDIFARFLSPFSSLVNLINRF